MVKGRIRRNLAPSKPPVGRAQFWRVLVACLLSSVQRADPGSPVQRFIKRKPFPLGLAFCEGDKKLAASAERILRAAGLRFGPKIAGQICRNLTRVKGKAWAACEAELERLRNEQTLEAERRAARYFDAAFEGIGPKQARNLLQTLGLTRYEVPLDSRIARWFREEFGFPVPLSPAALSDPDFYQFVEDGIHLLCRACGIYPCVLDACVFSRYEKQARTAEDDLW